MQVVFLGSQKSGVRSQKSEVRSQKSAGRSRKVEVRTGLPEVPAGKIPNPNSQIPNPELHAFIVWSAAALRGDPVDDLVRIGDIARLAVDAV